MVKSKLSFLHFLGNRTVLYILSTFSILSFISLETKAQTNGLHTVNPADDYAVLRDMTRSSEPNRPSSTNLEYRLNSDLTYSIKYFLGSNSFINKSDVDIYNRKIDAQPLVLQCFDLSG